MDRVQVWRGRFGDPSPPFGPLPGLRDGSSLAYEFELPERFIPWPMTTRLQRTYVLLELGVGLAIPCWQRISSEREDVLPGLDPDGSEPTTWYVDLLHVVDHGDKIVVRDLYLDVMVPTDGRHQRMLDLDEFADAIADGTVPVDIAIDGMRRWQAFLDECLHKSRGPQAQWTDFPPQQIRGLVATPAPLGPIVTWDG